MKYFKVENDVLSHWTGMHIRKQATLWGIPVEGAYDVYKIHRKGRYKGMQQPKRK